MVNVRTVFEGGGGVVIHSIHSYCISRCFCIQLLLKLFSFALFRRDCRKLVLNSLFESVFFLVVGEKYVAGYNLPVNKKLLNFSRVTVKMPVYSAASLLKVHNDIEDVWRTIKIKLKVIKVTIPFERKSATTDCCSLKLCFSFFRVFTVLKRLQLGR